MGADCEIGSRRLEVTHWGLRRDEPKVVWGFGFPARNHYTARVYRLATFFGGGGGWRGGGDAAWACEGQSRRRVFLRPVWLGALRLDRYPAQGNVYAEVNQLLT